MEKKDISKLVIYGGNFVAGAIPYLNNHGFGNFTGALVFGGLDFFKRVSPTINSSKYTRLIQLAGGVYYGCKSLADIVGTLSGGSDGLHNLGELVFDGSMAYQLISDSLENYDGDNIDMIPDIKEVGEDISRGFRKSGGRE